MTHKLINTGDYLLIVDDSEIKEGDWFYSPATKKALYASKDMLSWNNDTTQEHKGWKKIIAHLPLNNSPILEGVDLLPPLEDEVEKLEIEYFKELEERREIAKKFTGQVAGRHPDFFGHSEMIHMNRGFIEGYNKAKEKYKYTEEDLRKAFRSGAYMGSYTGNNSGKHIEEAEEKFIKSLQQLKMPVGFECEMITMNKGYTEESDYPYQQCDIPKTTTNSQGLTQWVGEYIY